MAVGLAAEPELTVNTYLLLNVLTLLQIFFDSLICVHICHELGQCLLFLAVCLVSVLAGFLKNENRRN